jgi:hypothetical protein
MASAIFRHGETSTGRYTMKALTRLLLACTVAFSSPLLLPATHADAWPTLRRPLPTRDDRLGIEWTWTLREGVYITAIYASSPLRSFCDIGDSIIEMNGYRTPHIIELTAFMGYLPPSSYVTFKVRKNLPPYPVDTSPPILIP